MLFKINISKKQKIAHKFQCSEIALVLMNEDPFIGASPDSDVDCSCCGNGLLEVKCPSSVKSEKPFHETFSYLKHAKNDKVTKQVFTKCTDKWVSLGKSL